MRPASARGGLRTAAPSQSSSTPVCRRLRATHHPPPGILFALLHVPDLVAAVPGAPADVEAALRYVLSLECDAEGRPGACGSAADAGPAASAACVRCHALAAASQSAPCNLGPTRLLPFPQVAAGTTPRRWGPGGTASRSCTGATEPQVRPARCRRPLSAAGSVCCQHCSSPCPPLLALYTPLRCISRPPCPSHAPFVG